MTAHMSARCLYSGIGWVGGSISMKELDHGPGPQCHVGRTRRLPGIATLRMMISGQSWMACIAIGANCRARSVLPRIDVGRRLNAVQAGALGCWLSDCPAELAMASPRGRAAQLRQARMAATNVPARDDGFDVPQAPGFRPLREQQRQQQVSLAQPPDTFVGARQLLIFVKSACWAATGSGTLAVTPVTHPRHQVGDQQEGPCVRSNNCSSVRSRLRGHVHQRAGV
jgi:hypothetical protein